MSKIVNLSKARKDRARRDQRMQADANAVKFGRTKSEKNREAKQADKDTRDLDGAKRED